MKHLIAACLFLLSFIHGSDLLAQRVTVSGIVRDAVSQETLPFASIEVMGTGQGTSTNADGFFTLIIQKSDSVTLKVLFLGYEPLIKPFSAQTSQQDVILELKPIVSQLGEIVVQAEGQSQTMKTGEQMSVVSISPAQLQNIPNIGERDIFRSFQLMAGVSGANESSSGLFVRGGTPDQNLVLLDGFTVYQVDHFYGFFSAFNSEAIKDARLYKGGFSAKYGGRLSSVLDLTAKTGNASKLTGSTNISLLSASAFVEGPISEKFTFFLSARRSYTDIIESPLYNRLFGLFNEAPETGDVDSGNDAVQRNIVSDVSSPIFYFYDLNAKLTFKPTSKDVISASLYSGADDLDNSRFQRNLIQIGQVRRTIFFQQDDITQWGNQGASLRWARQWTPQLYSNALVTYSNYYSKQDLDNLVTVSLPDTSLLVPFNSLETNSTKDISARLENDWKLTSSTNMAFGGFYSNNAIAYKLTQNDSVSVQNIDDQAQNAGGYLELNSKWNDRFEFNAGIRGTWYEQTDQTYIEPRISGTIKVHEHVKLKAAWGQFYQFVNRVVRENISQGSRDFWLLANNETNSVSSATHLIGGVLFDWDTWLFDVEAYQKDLNGLSEFSTRITGAGTNPDAQQFFFEGSGVSRGVEFLLQRKTGALSGWINYTLGEVVYEFPGLNDGPFYAQHDVRHETKIVGSYAKGWLTLGASWMYATGRPYSAPFGEYTLSLLDNQEFTYITIGQKNVFRLPDYHRLDLSATANVKNEKGKDMSFGVSLFNVYNRRNIWYKEFDIVDGNVVESNIAFLGFTPNFFFKASF